jgi:peroxiredoxin
VLRVPRRLLVQAGVSAVAGAAIGGGAFAAYTAVKSGALPSFQPPAPTVQVGQPAPDIVLPATTGAVLTLSSLRGSNVLVNFWATWCVPCKQELPAIQAFAASHTARWTVFAVNELEATPSVVAFAQELRLTYPIVLDTDGAVATTYRINGLPTTVVVDAQGIVRVIHLGPLVEGDLQQFAATYA